MPDFPLQIQGEMRALIINMVWQKGIKTTGSYTKVIDTSTSFLPEGLLSYLLCEDDTFLLQEDDFKIALEWYWLHGPKSTGSFSQKNKPTGSWTII